MYAQPHALAFGLRDQSFDPFFISASYDSSIFTPTMIFHSAKRFGPHV
jgi:hypothetical protein